MSAAEQEPVTGGIVDALAAEARPAQKPSVGRVVHYRSYGTPQGEYKPECRAAVITAVGGWRTVDGDDPSDVWEDDGQRYRSLKQVWDPERCALTVLNPGGTFLNDCNHDEDQAGGTWHWPERV